MKKFDELSTTFVLLVIGIIITLFGAIKANTKALLSGLSIIFISGFYLVYLIKKGTARIVENNYNDKLFYKPEHGEINQLQPHETGTAIDGIQIAGETRKVRKFHNGVRVKIDNTGKARSVNFVSRAIGQNDLTKKQLPQDWNKLFEKIK